MCKILLCDKRYSLISFVLRKSYTLTPFSGMPLYSEVIKLMVFHKTTVENAGIDPATSHMLSERSTI